MVSDRIIDAKVSKILLIDDHPLVRRGVTAIIEREPDLTVCGEAETEADALALLRAKSPDLLIVDLGLREGSGLELIHRVRDLGIRTPILVLSMREEALFTERVIRAGAQGYVSKSAPCESLIPGIRQVLRNELAISPQASTRLVRWAIGGESGKRAPCGAVEQLSRRELEIVELAGRGLSVADIASKLNISTKTVQSHRENIKAKLELGTNAELTRFAVLWTEGVHRAG